MGGPEGRGQRVSKLGSFDRDIPGWNTATVSNMRMGGKPNRRPGPARSALTADGEPNAA